MPRSRTGRIPQWVLDEALERPIPEPGFRQWSPPGQRAGARDRRSRSRGPTLPLLLAAAVVLAVATGVVSAIRADVTAGTTPAPTPVRTGGTSYAFLREDPPTGEPVGYDPCTPIDVVIRPAGAPPDGQAMIEEALDSVAAVSGLAFRVVGPTDRAPATLGSPSPPWEPVLIAWSDEAESPSLAGEVAGSAGSVAAQGPTGGRLYLRTGQVVLDRDALTARTGTPEGRAAVIGVITHEVGHLVGLDHVDDPGELMHPQSQPGTTRMGPGDLTALRRLGAIDCEGGR